MPESPFELRIAQVPMNRPDAARLCGIAHDELMARYGPFVSDERSVCFEKVLV